MVNFCDTSALIALFNPDDPNHQKAIDIVKRESKRIFMISNYIFAETVTMLSQRTDKETSIRSGEHIKKTYHIITLDKDSEDLAWDIFKKQKSKNVSFVDCTTFALFKKGVFDKAFSFDKDFKTNHIPLV